MFNSDLILKQEILKIMTTDKQIELMLTQNV